MSNPPALALLFRTGAQKPGREKVADGVVLKNGDAATGKKIGRGAFSPVTRRSSLSQEPAA